MKTVKYYIAAALIGLAFTGTSCVGDLDTVPLSDREKTSDKVLGNQEAPYLESLAKIYAGMVMAGNAGGDNDVDVSGVDGGSQASFLRVLWNMQELTTDMAHCAWTDDGIPGFNMVTWGANSPWIKGNYYRLFYQINLSNALLRETTEDKIAKRGITGEVARHLKQYRAEARLLRAMNYWYLLDLYRNVPLVTEDSPLGEKDKLPTQISPKELFSFIETELKSLLESGDLLKPVVGYSQQYGHADTSLAWAMLSRLYLNAEVYIGENRYSDCIAACKEILKVGYELEPEYGDMFKADNHTSKEMIFPIRYEGEETLTWGGMTSFLCWGSAELKDVTNAKDAWQGVRAKSSLLRLFEKEKESDKDNRKAMLHTDLTQNIEIVDQTAFKDNGIPVAKYYNVNKDGSMPPSKEAWIDFPLIRLAEIYLSYAEAVLRGGQGGDRATALKYVNDLRKRAYKDKAAAVITESDFNLDFLLDEKGREFFFEAQRRTDLIRFGKFTGSSYLWPWKGGIPGGKAVEEYLKLFPLPSDEIGSNTALIQNEGYKR